MQTAVLPQSQLLISCSKYEYEVEDLVLQFSLTIIHSIIVKLEQRITRGLLFLLRLSMTIVERNVPFLCDLLKDRIHTYILKKTKNQTQNPKHTHTHTSSLNHSCEARGLLEVLLSKVLVQPSFLSFTMFNQWYTAIIPVDLHLPFCLFCCLSSFLSITFSAFFETSH